MAPVSALLQSRRHWLPLADSGCILIVDDDPGIREMLVESLSDREYHVRAADSGAAMRAEIERDLPDLVLLDIRLPGEDGPMLARYLRGRYDVGIIMVTVSGDVIDRVVGLELGADDYVAKPFDPREVLARIKSMMRRMQARPQADEASPPVIRKRRGSAWHSAVVSSTSTRGACSSEAAPRSH